MPTHFRHTAVGMLAAMARPPRPQIPNGLYHVFARGVDGSPIYIDDRDHIDFLLYLELVVPRYGWRILSHCELDNHFHLILRTPEPTLSAGMQWLNAGYCQEFNRRHGRRGHRLQQRFGAVVIDSDEQLLEELRYVALNPVRAGVCTAPDAWPWSSFRALVGLEDPPSFLAVDDVLALFGRNRERARERFARFVADGLPARA